MSIYRIAGGIGIILLALPLLGILAVPSLVTGLFLLVAGIALLAGL